jgi:hypothetical protein
VGIHWLLHSSFCFLNINTAITWQLIRTVRMLEAEWWQVCWEAWVWGQRKMSQVLGMFGLLDFTMLQPVLAWCAFLNLWTVYFFNFPIFLGGPRITETTDTESAEMAVHLCRVSQKSFFTYTAFISNISQTELSRVFANKIRHTDAFLQSHWGGGGGAFLTSPVISHTLSLQHCWWNGVITN